MSHISYSALKVFTECPFRYKLIYEDKAARSGASEYTSFGTALHESAELKIQDENVNEVEVFLNKFDSEIKLLKEQTSKIDEELLTEMRQQGITLAPQVIPALKKTFKDFKLLSAEEDLFEAIKQFPELNYNFKGFIDLVIQTPDEKIHIIDYKSCAWGWDAKKKGDPLTTYQLTFYKQFYAQKHGIDPKNIETYFALLKRTAKKNNVEIFRVTSGPKKTQNAFNMMKKALYNINKKNFPKNRTSCKYCEFYKKPECP